MGFGIPLAQLVGLRWTVLAQLLELPTRIDSIKKNSQTPLFSQSGSLLG